MKKIALKLLIIVYILLPITNIKALEINSENAVLYNMNEDTILYEKNADKKVKVASLTKIMTSILALENIEDYKKEIEMPKEAYTGLEDYVTSGIQPYEKVTIEDLLYGTMLPSAADCANALAIEVSGNIDNFVELMNQKAQELGMTSTHFSNPIGMDDDNYSTVKDIAILLKYALKNETFYQIFTTKEYKTTNNILLESTLIEKSQPYGIDVTNILGSKTGFTDEAGNCLASISKINKVKYLLITTNASIEKSYHIADARDVYDYFSSNYGYKKIIGENQLIKTIKIKDIIEKEYNIYADVDKYMYLENGFNINNLTYEYEGIEEITRDTNQEEKLGKIIIKSADKVLYEYDVFLDEKIEFYDMKLLLLIPVVIIVLIIIKKQKK
jgi:D-alanyl-D-alanine carboxypeptidase (penicillin-binding protein 5/6)